MGSILSSVIGFVPSLISGLFDHFKTRSERKAAIEAMKHEAYLANLEATKQYAAQEQAAKHEWAKEQAKRSDRGRSLMEWLLFVIIFAPIVAALGDAVYGTTYVKLYFDTLTSSVPEWWVAMMVGIVMAVYGIPTLMKFKEFRKK